MAKSIILLFLYFLLFIGCTKFPRRPEFHLYDFGFVNTNINELLNNELFLASDSIKLIGFPYFMRSGNPTQKLCDSMIMFRKPYLLCSTSQLRKSKTEFINQDGEVFVMKNGKLYMIILRQWETNKYVTIVKKDNWYYKDAEIVCRKMLDLSLSQGFIMFDYSTSTYYISTNNKIYFFDYKKKTFEEVNFNK